MLEPPAFPWKGCWLSISASAECSSQTIKWTTLLWTNHSNVKHFHCFSISRVNSKCRFWSLNPQKILVEGYPKDCLPTWTCPSICFRDSSWGLSTLVGKLGCYHREDFFQWWCSNYRTLSPLDVFTWCFFYCLLCTSKKHILFLYPLNELQWHWRSFYTIFIWAPYLFIKIISCPSSQRSSALFYLLLLFPVSSCCFYCILVLPWGHLARIGMESLQTNNVSVIWQREIWWFLMTAPV